MFLSACETRGDNGDCGGLINAQSKRPRAAQAYRTLTNLIETALLFYLDARNKKAKASK
jgi:hypothetical protein